MKVEIKMTAVVRVCDARQKIVSSHLKKHELTLNNRGGTMGDRVVNISFIEAINNSAHPTQRRAMVSAEDP